MTEVDLAELRTWLHGESGTGRPPDPAHHQCRPRLERWRNCGSWPDAVRKLVPAGRSPSWAEGTEDGRAGYATEQAERKSALVDRVTKAPGIVSSADWAQTVIISIVLGFGARFALASLGVILNN
ncbi:MAG: hypothetical protein F4213_21380 [Boseongicola sp. SB0677_bin_26]|nr:hypothetical protein [Boseongicola sp. SB0665_bin_10]MYG28534.1 hypothetical protein [Boseongicola sp. SB0677_bin_26]